MAPTAPSHGISEQQGVLAGWEWAELTGWAYTATSVPNYTHTCTPRHACTYIYMHTRAHTSDAQVQTTRQTRESHRSHNHGRESKAFQEKCLLLRERGLCLWRPDSHCQPAGRGLLFRLKYFMCIITVHPHSRLLG